MCLKGFVETEGEWLAEGVVADFLKANGQSFKGEGTKVLAGIRLGDLKRAEVSAWLKGLGDKDES